MMPVKPVDESQLASSRGRNLLLRKQHNPKYGAQGPPRPHGAQLEEVSRRCKDNVESVARECIQNGQKFVDEDFPYGPKALWVNGKSPSNSGITIDPTEISWGRFCDIFPNIDNGYSGINRTYVSFKLIGGGIFDTTYLQSAVGGLECSDEWSGEMMVTYNPEAGVAGVRMYKDGCWVYELVDDYLPMKLDGELACARSSALGSYWLSFFEKCQAKIYGSYESISGMGTVSEGIEDLCGATLLNVEVRKFDIWLDLWQLLEEKLQNGCVIVATPRTGTARGHEGPSGLLSGHGYPVTKVQIAGGLIIQIANPWPRGGWNGESIDSFDTEENEKYSKRHNCSWISLEEFCYHFTELTIARIPSCYCQSISFVHGANRPTYPVISVMSPTTMTVVITQTDRRWGGHRPTTAVGFCIYRCLVHAMDYLGDFKPIDIAQRVPLSKSRYLITELEVRPEYCYIVALESTQSISQLLVHIIVKHRMRSRELLGQEISNFCLVKEQVCLHADHSQLPQSHQPHPPPPPQQSHPPPYHGCSKQIEPGIQNYDRNSSLLDGSDFLQSIIADLTPNGGFPTCVATLAKKCLESDIDSSEMYTPQLTPSQQIDDIPTEQNVAPLLISKGSKSDFLRRNSSETPTAA
eukprot:GHVL01044605.1.p1 GENE.GHVL01044605.1~~GHVL01044605.1.p1  ORF type:complete len:635 (-),score=113.96 GHVL01044605.1:851-2755(-)